MKEDGKIVGGARARVPRTVDGDARVDRTTDGERRDVQSGSVGRFDGEDQSTKMWASSS